MNKFKHRSTVNNLPCEKKYRKVCYDKIQNKTHPSDKKVRLDNMRLEESDERFLLSIHLNVGKKVFGSEEVIL